MISSVPSRPKAGTDCARVLDILEAANGAWVADLYGKTHVMVHSRVSDLRKKGFTIEQRRFGQGDYRYRLVGVSPQDATGNPLLFGGAA